MMKQENFISIGRGLLWWSVLAGMAGLAAGCAVMRPATETARQFVLDPDAYEAFSPEEAQHQVSLQVRRVEVSRYLDVPGIAIRENRNQLRYSVDRRWAEPLDVGLSRLIRENLKEEGFVYHVTSGPAQYEAVDMELQVRLLRCEGIIEDGTARGVFRADWELRDGREGNLLDRGEVREDALEWNGNDYGMLVAGFSEAGNRVSKDIAEALAALAAGGYGEETR